MSLATQVSALATRAGTEAKSLWAAVNAKAPLASPALTGTPTVPTALPGTNTTQAASTAFVTAAVAAGGGGSVTVNDASLILAIQVFG